VTIGSDQSVTFAGSQTFSGGTANGVLYLNGSKAATSGSALVFDGSNLGLGVTPSAWGTLSVIQVKNASIGGVTNEAHYSGNCYYQSGWKYISNGYAARYSQNDVAGGAHAWFTAASGTAGNAITFTQAMTLDASGNLNIGNTSINSNFRLNLTSPSGNGGVVFVPASDGATVPVLRMLNAALSTNVAEIGTASGTALYFSTGGTERMRLDASGNLGVGTTSPDSIITFAGNITSKGSDSYGIGTNGGNNHFNVFATGASGAVRFWTGGSSATSVGGGGTERARINSSGQFMVGTTSPLGSPATFYGSTATVVISQGSASSYAGLRIYNDANSSGRALEIDYYGTSAGERAEIFCTGAYPLLFGTSNTERARIDSSGNFGIGVTSMAQKLQVNGKAIIGSYASTGAYGLYLRSDASSSHYNWQISTQNVIDGGFEIARSSATGGTTFNNPSLVINSSGYLLSGTISSGIYRGQNAQIESYRVNGSALNVVSDSTTSATQQVIGIYHRATSGTRWMMEFSTDNPSAVTVGSITSNGSSTAYNTSSDYRLKNTVAPMTGALAKVAALKPVTYKWNSTGADGEGFIAHELAEVCPHAVAGEKDAVDKNGDPAYQGIDVSYLVATLTAAIQEQQAIIQQLQADVAALRGTA
jgi:hypothetical protein